MEKQQLHVELLVKLNERENVCTFKNFFQMEPLWEFFALSERSFC